MQPLGIFLRASVIAETLHDFTTPPSADLCWKVSLSEMELQARYAAGS